MQIANVDKACSGLGFRVANIDSAFSDAAFLGREMLQGRCTKVVNVDRPFMRFAAVQWGCGGGEALSFRCCIPGSYPSPGKSAAALPNYVSDCI